MELGYPRSVKSNWLGVPTPVSAALTWTNGKTFFFRNGKYWRFDDDKYEIDRKASIPYPRTIGKWWFGCEGGDVRTNTNNGGWTKSKTKNGTVYTFRRIKRWGK